MAISAISSIDLYVLYSLLVQYNKKWMRQLVTILKIQFYIQFIN